MQSFSASVGFSLEIWILNLFEEPGISKVGHTCLKFMWDPYLSPYCKLLVVYTPFGFVVLCFSDSLSYCPSEE